MEATSDQQLKPNFARDEQRAAWGDLVDACYRPKMHVNLITNKEVLAFLIHMLLIKSLHSTCPWRKLCMQEFD
jgi:hypothetical protein